MEALVILLAEFLVAFVVPAIVLAVEIVTILIGLLIELATWLLFAKRRAASPLRTIASTVSAWRGKATVGRFERWGGIVRPITAVAFVGLVLTISGLVLVNTLFFEPTMRQVVGFVAKRTGTELDFKSVSGNLFTGRFAFENVSARRVSDTKASFDLKVGGLIGEIDLRTLLIGPISFGRLSVDTVSGTFRVQEKRGTGDNVLDDGRVRTKRRFRIEDLTLRDVNVALSKGDGAPVALSLKAVTSMPLRSNFAAFDLLFRSNVVGQIDGHDIFISVRNTDGGRLTQWRMPDLPIASVSRFVTKPPIGWLREGTLNVSVDDRWVLARRAEIDMDWDIRMRGARAGPRKGASMLQQTFALPIIAYINSKNGNIDLRFKLVMNESQFEDLVSPDAGDLWNTLVRSMSKAITTGTGTTTEEAERGINTAVKGFKGLLDKVRKPPGNQ
ncbi:MAG TPA: hypothetical protein VG758_20380 [Hyphomicrobiaceae bacterium]|jgi:hypothetical protein|nr:hypothetical protein [Hyphomicrobiaceae bacterium]